MNSVGLWSFSMKDSDWNTAGGWAPHRCPVCHLKFPILKRLIWRWRYEELEYGRFGSSSRWAGHATRSRHIHRCRTHLPVGQATLAMYTNTSSKK